MVSRGSERVEVEVGGRAVVEPLEIGRAEIGRGCLLTVQRLVSIWLQRTGEPPRAPAERGLEGWSPAMDALRVEAAIAAARGEAVLIEGPPGSEPGGVARALHRAAGGGADGFVELRLEEMSADEIRAALGADTRDGAAWTTAEVVFLRDVDWLPLDVQLAVQRLIARRRPRVIASTVRDLAALAAERRFRQPLAATLRAGRVRLPPLRDRGGDIARLLVERVRLELRRLGAEARLEETRRPWLTRSVMQWALRQPWHGDEGELDRFARALVHRWHGAPHARCPDDGTDSDERAPVTAPPAAPSAARPGEIDRARLEAVLQRASYNLAAAARALAVSRTTLYALMAKWGFRRAEELSAREVEAATRAVGTDPAALAAHLRVSAKALARRRRELSLDTAP
ncbi:MAG: helix-turn-helix domain-containing protein [bacterium]